MMLRLPALLATIALALLVFGGSSGAQSNPGLRVLAVTSHNDKTGAKHVDKFFVAPDDRIYVTRHEAEVIHTNDGSVASVDFEAGYTFGNMTLTRVGR